MMKQALVVFALIGLAFSAPQPRKLFHEHVEDFINIIFEESSQEMEQLVEQYLEFDEFVTTLQYIQTNNFKDLVYEMEAVPEFVAMLDFLENDNIDIHYFIDMFNDILENGRMKKSARLTASGRDLTSFIYDCIEIFPSEKLAALYDEKITNDEEFRNSINNLQSDEWNDIAVALWENETFLNEIKTLSDNGIDAIAFYNELLAIFGQK